MTRLSMLGYAIRQGIKNLYRNRMFSLASLGTIAACVFMFGIFFSIILNFQYMVKSVESQVGFTVFFHEGISKKQIKAIGKKLEERPEVDSVAYTSAEEAWQRFCQENFEDEKELRKSFGDDNPLENSASYEVNLKEVEHQEDVIAFARNLKGVRQVNSSNTVAKTLTGVNRFIAFVSGAVVALLLAVAVFLISTTVTMGISVRRGEIAIMRLVGATDFFIRAPFVVEGILIGLVGTCIPLLALYLAYGRAVDFVIHKFQSLSAFLTFLDVNAVFLALTPLSLAMGIGIGFLGSFLTVRRHLNV